MEELKLVVLGIDETEEGGGCDNNREREKLERHWFGVSGSGDNSRCVNGEEAGMTEHEFAEFVDSLDMDCGGGGGGSNE